MARVHTNTTPAVPQQGIIVPIQQRTPAHVQVQNLQSLKSAQPYPRIRGYHRNLIVAQVSTTKNHPITSYQISAVHFHIHA